MEHLLLLQASASLLQFRLEHGCKVRVPQKEGAKNRGAWGVVVQKDSAHLKQGWARLQP